MSAVGTHVTILMTGEDENEEYDIVGRTEADPLNGKISDESPVGHALLGKAVGDKAEVLLPTGHTVEYDRAEHHPRCRLSRLNE